MISLSIGKLGRDSKFNHVNMKKEFWGKIQYYINKGIALVSMRDFLKKIVQTSRLLHSSVFIGTYFYNCNQLLAVITVFKLIFKNILNNNVKCNI